VSAPQRYTNEQVREMRELAARGETAEEIASTYGATAAYVRQVLIGTRRRNAGGPIAPRVRRERKPTNARSLTELRRRVKDLEDAMTLVLRATLGPRPSLTACPSAESPAPTLPPSTSTVAGATS